MNWYDRIRSLINAPDVSRDLRRGEVKTLLLDSFAREIPSFDYATCKNGIYYFQRTKDYRGFTLYETLHAGFSLADRSFTCSVSSCFNRTYQFDHNYNLGPLNPHCDLIALKKGGGPISIDEAYYFHNGKLATTTKVVDTIANDFGTYGQRFLSERFSRLKDDMILNAGLDFVSGMSADKRKLKADLDSEMKAAKYLVMKIENPLYVELKSLLFAVPGQDREARQGILGLAYELLEFYCDL